MQTEVSSTPLRDAAASAGKRLASVVAASAAKRLASVTAALILAACAAGGNTVPAGYYRVRPHDTLTRIARRYGTSVQDLVRWNHLKNPHSIDVGQVLRVARTGGESMARGVATRPRASTPPAAGPARPAAPSRSAPDIAERPAARIALVWPATGELVGRFDRTHNKGINLAGALDTPVYAAAAGKVVYAGNRLRGYGNLLIIKHGDDFLTVYAHNRLLLVKEGASVRQHERIALMGSSDSQRVMLHFELRYRGRSIDPLDYLPPR